MYAYALMLSHRTHTYYFPKLLAKKRTPLQMITTTKNANKAEQLFRINTFFPFGYT